MNSKTVSFSKDSTNVFFHILTQCNLNCRHCYINKEQHGSQILSAEEIEAWLKLFSDKRKEANVIFLGGEPTLNPDLAVAVKKAREIGYKSITIDTNGYLFNGILDKITPEDVDFISFSLDGATKETNDAIRGEGCYENCIKGIKNAVTKGFSTSLIYTVSGANIHELDKMGPLLVELGIKEFFIQVIGIRGNSKEFTFNDSVQVSRDMWETIVPKTAELISKKGISVTYPKVFLSKDDVFECAGNVADNYFVFPNGRVYRCPLCEDFPVNDLVIKENRLVKAPKLTESDFFQLNIPEGCVMNKMVQPDNLQYDEENKPEYKIACCLLKERFSC